MKNFITELYYGNIDPQSRGFKKDSYLQKQMKTLTESEELLTKKLSGEKKNAFISFANASNIILGESELDTFIVGFRLGAKFAYDTFVDDNAPYADFMLNFAGDEFDMMISVSPRTLIISSAITLGVSILVSFLFRRKINKLNMVEALKGVE